jgi:hypothetical protein
MIEDRPFPHEIREAWHAVIDPSDLTSDEKERAASSSKCNTIEECSGRRRIS